MARTAAGKRKRDYGLRKNSSGIWHCDFSVAGKRIQRSTFTEDRAQAEEWCAQTASRVWRERQLGENPPITLSAACALWLDAKAREGKHDLANDKDKAQRFIDCLGAGRNLHELTTETVERVLDALTQERSWSNATRNRNRSFLVSVVKFVKQKGYATPELSLTRMREPVDRVRWITREEARTLIDALPLHLQRMVRFSLATGLRQANVTGLCWRSVDMTRRLAWVVAENAKGRRSISIPLNDEAMAVLREASNCDKHGDSEVVFTYYRQPVAQPANWAWFKALKRVDIKDFRWHDMRHTWASWHVMAGTPLPVLQKLGGWADIRMVMKYAHLAPDFTAQYAGNVSVGEQPASATVHKIGEAA